MALALQGAPEGTMVVADEQTAGRGRLGRSWDSAPAAGLWCSTLVRPTQRATLLPLVAAVAAARALRDRGVAASVKWPNDLVVDADAHDGSPGPRKVGGILAEAQGDAVVLGIGINLAHGHADLPVAQATSVALEGGDAERAALLSCLAAHLHEGVSALARGEDVLADYRPLCLSLGRQVRVALPDGTSLVGRAAAVADDGRLEVVSDGNRQSVAAGDVIHATI